MEIEPMKPVFLFGAQYYRAPTPDSACWEMDLRRMREMGFNSVKYWVQWRWSHRRDDRFVFDDLDRLMDLAATHGLAVHLNTIFDVPPHWLYERYPDAKQVMNRYGIVEPHEVAHRQLGGNPGPCYSHPGARAERNRFLIATVDHFKAHPALTAWDVWNEPELCFPQRKPDIHTLACYCSHCYAGFVAWLERKYQTLGRLNTVWGRCYERWQDVEMPRTGLTITDFIDWREYHVDTLTAEARWRFAVVRERDPGRTAFLHLVPNLMTAWHTTTCATDDWELLAESDWAAASFNDSGDRASQLVSAGRGKIVYNTESHINYGMTNMHPRRIELATVVQALAPQIGAGFRGFQFWQFRAESLGFEAPAWGLVNLDGSDRPVTHAVTEFIERLRPHTDRLLACPPAPTRVAVWKSRKNEVFHFCIHQDTSALRASVEAWQEALYWRNIPFRVITDQTLAAGELDGLNLIILPMPYYLTEPEARELERFVAGGGVVVSEAHLAGYNGTLGRHSPRLPGCGLAEAWGLWEYDSMSSTHLNLNLAQRFSGPMTDDVKRALADSGNRGGLHFPLHLTDGGVGWGADRYAALDGNDLFVEGTFDGCRPCVVSKAVGCGHVFYSGTNLGQVSGHDLSALQTILSKALDQTGIRPTLGLRCGTSGAVHIDLLSDAEGPRHLFILNRTDDVQTIRLELEASLIGIFTDVQWTGTQGSPVTVPPRFCELMVVHELEKRLSRPK